MKRAAAKKAVFLDRDGILNIDKGYTYKVEDLIMCEGVGDGLARLAAAGFKLIVVTNQSGIARGYYTLKDVDVFHSAMQTELARTHHVMIDRFYICPHLTNGKIPTYTMNCECRKPGTKNVEVAIKELSLDRAKCFMVGDKISDVECAKRAGLYAVQIPHPKDGPSPSADFVTDHFTKAVDHILIVGDPSLCSG